MASTLASAGAECRRSDTDDGTPSEDDEGRRPAAAPAPEEGALPIATLKRRRSTCFAEAGVASALSSTLMSRPCPLSRRFRPNRYADCISRLGAHTDSEMLDPPAPPAAIVMQLESGADAAAADCNSALCLPLETHADINREHKMRGMSVCFFARTQRTSLPTGTTALLQR